jgi:hypothetical protein
MSKSHLRSFLLLLALLRALPLFGQESLSISSSVLEVRLYGDRPAVSSYLHKATGSRFEGAGRDGVLAINGNAVPWSEWRIAKQRQPGAVVYAMSLPAEGISFDYAFAVKGNVLEMELRNIRDPGKNLKTVQWKDLPLLVNPDPEYKYWRLITSAPDAGGKMWTAEVSGATGTSPPESVAVPVIYGTQYRSERLCVFAHSNYPLFPFTHQVIEGKRYAISINTYQYRVRQRTMPPLRVQVVFLGDLNGDGVADVSDYRLWVNRCLPEGDSLYATHIWYKIFLDHRDSGVKTTFRQAGEIVQAIHNVTDGLPQLVYLVGWQEGGHDAQYPAMDSVNQRAGGATALRELCEVSKQKYRALISYHTNIDDAYPGNKDYDPKILANPHAICHTLDTESGKIFRRLEAMMHAVPVEKTLHFDNMRITNCVPGGCPEGIGILEELTCGLQPVIGWLRAKGITVATEGQNGEPIDLTQLVAGLWHYDLPLGSRQIFHRKLFGGGYGDHYGPPVPLDLGLGSSIHQDFTYRPWKNPDLEDIHVEWLTLSFERDWDEMVRRIYLGSLLYQFYLEREMTKFDGDRDGFTARYGKVVDVVYRKPDTLRVTWNDVVIAEGGDRFIPRGNAIYAYSAQGSERSWMLPSAFRDKPLQVFTLGKNGRGPAPEYRLEPDRVWLKLVPKTPVKLILKNLDKTSRCKTCQPRLMAIGERQ